MTPSPQQYVTISRRALDVEDYIDIVRRHVTWILAPLFAGLVISCVVAFSLPNTYVSKAIMRISPAQISESMVPSTVNQQMYERIGQLQQDILSNSSLSDLIQRPALNLYPKERDSQPLLDVIERMKSRDIKISLFSLAGNRPASAFQIEYAYPNRFKAQAVVNALITRFMESMMTVQGMAGKVTSDFLKEEIAQAKGDLNRLDTDITNFRIQNAGHLPEELQVNSQALNGLQQQMSAVNDSLSRLSEEKLTLETNLQTLKMQRDTYNSMVEGTQEPGSVAKIQNERLAQLNREITDYESQLLQLREMYTDTYPNIRNAKAQLALKKKERDQLQIKEEQEALKPKAPSAKKPTNPMLQERLNEIQGNIDMVNTQLRNKESERLQRLKQLDDINKNMATFQNRISQVPANQQKYVALIREHELASARYQDLMRRESAATTYEHVGTRKAGENLEVLDSATLPEAPTAPNRMMITGIGAGMGLMLGVFLAGVKEVKDTSLKNLKDVRAYTNLPILSSIPLLENDLLVRRKRRLAYVGWAASIILGIVAMSGSMYYHYFLRSS